MLARLLTCLTIKQLLLISFFINEVSSFFLRVLHISIWKKRTNEIEFPDACCRNSEFIPSNCLLIKTLAKFKNVHPKSNKGSWLHWIRNYIKKIRNEFFVLIACFLFINFYFFLFNFYLFTFIISFFFKRIALNTITSYYSEIQVYMHPLSFCFLRCQTKSMPVTFA